MILVGQNQSLEMKWKLIIKILYLQSIKKNEILYENKKLKIEELSNFIISKNKKYILDLDKEASIPFFNRIMNEFKEKDIKKVFVKVIEI